MKALFIGGTGTISMAISKLLLQKGWDLYLINRGNRNSDERLKGAHFITVDINDETAAAEKLAGMQFDVACDFIGFVPSQLERDYRLLKGKVRMVPGIEKYLGGAPFSLPILVENRDEIQKKLAASGVYAPVLWPISDEARKACTISALMADKMLSIPIDQRYSWDDIEDIAKIIITIVK